jgi:taurine dioxygenase
MLVTALPCGFGAEVTGFNLLRGGTRDEITRLRQAYHDRHLLVFRDAAGLPPERQVEVTGWFGPVLVEGTAWTVLDNAEPAGSYRLPFHSDITFLAHPLAGICLHPLALPKGGTSTTFVSTAVAWDALPPELQRALHGRKARHYYESAGNIDLGLAVFEYWHPLRMTHAATGRPLLFATEHHVDRIEGLDDARGAEVLAQLFAALYAPSRQYEHVWREGDLLVWDNIAIQHARPKVAEPAQGSRIMRRVQLGTHSFLSQIEALRAGQAALAV